ncbi:MAG: hypothetical protein AB8C95_00075 [Phycisphaeraceae bacterium]
MDDIDKKAILKAVFNQYQLYWRGIHGVEHWARVMHNGLLLADQVSADRRVVTLFALFHDACRLNDGYDPQHGSRGAAFALSLRGKLFDLDLPAMEMLHYACCRHTDGLTEADPTVQVCWDADRLDLERVGMTPLPRYLCTEQAKDPAIIEAASRRACSGKHPDCLPGLPNGFQS